MKKIAWTLARWVDHHWWVPFLFGTDGLTGRERRRMADIHAATIGNPHPRPESIRGEKPE